MSSSAFTAGLATIEHLTRAAGMTDKLDAAVIWLHGLGADGHDFEQIVPVMRRCNELAIRFVFPHAPVQAVTINGGMRMRAWYDIRSIDLTGVRELDRAGMQNSCRMVHALLDRIKHAHKLTDEQIILAGFSQGGVIALRTGLTYPKLAGIIGLSCYLPELPEAPAAGMQTPVFIAHGRQDPMVPFQLGQQAADKLQALGLAVTWKEYPVAHGVLPEELAAVDEWIAQVLQDAAGTVANPA